MRFMTFLSGDREGLAASEENGAWRGLAADAHGYPGSLDALVRRGEGALSAAYRALLEGPEVDLSRVEVLPPLRQPGKILCVGLNYRDHSAESGFQQPDYPPLFGRFTSGLIGHGQPMVRPRASIQLDYEGELVAVIGARGRHISPGKALGHVLGYSIFNDGSVRDYQTKAPQWTMGKNFDGTGGFGPVFVTADELPPGGKGLRLQTRLNGATVQSASTDDMVFDVQALVSIISEVMTLEAGDLIVTGTPSGIGLARKPPLWMKAGDVVEVEIERIGILRNPVIDEITRAS